MINNYLEYARKRRAYAIQEGRRALHLSRAEGHNWLNGFYRGMRIPWDAEARHWKWLQKDIEEHKKHCDELVWIPPGVTIYEGEFVS